MAVVVVAVVVVAVVDRTYDEPLVRSSNDGEIGLHLQTVLYTTKDKEFRSMPKYT